MLTTHRNLIYLFIYVNVDIFCVHDVTSVNTCIFISLIFLNGMKNEFIEDETPF